MDPSQSSFVVPPGPQWFGVRTGKRKEHPSPAQSPTSVGINLAVLANAKRRGVEAPAGAGGAGGRQAGPAIIGVASAAPAAPASKLAPAGRASGGGGGRSGGGSKQQAAQEAAAAVPVVGSGLKHLGGLGALTWSAEEDALLREAIARVGSADWAKVAAHVPRRTAQQCMSRWVKALQQGTAQGPWSAYEDNQIRAAVAEVGVANVKWSELASRLPGRIGKQCRERWFNHLDPVIKRGAFEPEEDQVIVEAQRLFGNRWCDIAKLLPGRTENAVKNRWNSAARKRWSTELQSYQSMSVPVPLVPLEVVHASLARSVPAEAAQVLLSSLATPFTQYLLIASPHAAAAAAASSSSQSSGGSGATYADRVRAGLAQSGASPSQRGGVHPSPGEEEGGEAGYSAFAAAPAMASGGAGGEGMAAHSAPSGLAAGGPPRSILPSQFVMGGMGPGGLHYQPLPSIAPVAAAVPSSGTLVMNPFLGGRRYIPGVGWPDFLPAPSLLEALPLKIAAIFPFLASPHSLPPLFPAGEDGPMTPFAFMPVIFSEGRTGVLGSTLGGWFSPPMPLPGHSGAAKEAGGSGDGGRGKAAGAKSSGGAGSSSRSGRGGREAAAAAENEYATVRRGSRSRGGAAAASSSSPQTLAEEGGAFSRGGSRAGTRSATWRSGLRSRMADADEDDEEAEADEEEDGEEGGEQSSDYEGEGTLALHEGGQDVAVEGGAVSGSSPSDGDDAASRLWQTAPGSAALGLRGAPPAKPEGAKPFQPPTLAMQLASPANETAPLFTGNMSAVSGAVPRLAGAGYVPGQPMMMTNMASPFGGASGMAGRGFYDPLHEPHANEGSGLHMLGYPANGMQPYLASGRPSVGHLGASPTAAGGAGMAFSGGAGGYPHPSLSMAEFDATGGAASRARLFSPAGMSAFPGAASAGAWGAGSAAAPAVGAADAARHGYSHHDQASGGISTSMGDLTLYGGAVAGAGEGGAGAPAPATVKFRLTRAQLRELGIVVARGERLTPEQMKLAMERLEQVGKNSCVEFTERQGDAAAEGSDAPAAVAASAAGGKGSKGPHARAGKGGKEKAGGGDVSVASTSAQSTPVAPSDGEGDTSGASASAVGFGANRKGGKRGAAGKGPASDSPSRPRPLPPIPEAATLPVGVETGVLHETGPHRPTRAAAAAAASTGTRSVSRNSASSVSPRSQASGGGYDQLRLDRFHIEEGEGQPDNDSPACLLPLETPGSGAPTPGSGPLTLSGVPFLPPFVETSGGGGSGAAASGAPTLSAPGAPPAEAPLPTSTVSWSYFPGQPQQQQQAAQRSVALTAAPPLAPTPLTADPAASGPAPSPLSGMLPQLRVDTAGPGRYHAGQLTLQQLQQYHQQQTLQLHLLHQHQQQLHMQSFPGSGAYPGSPEGQPFHLGAVTFLQPAAPPAVPVAAAATIGGGARGFPAVLSPTNVDNTGLLFGPSAVAAWQRTAGTAHAPLHTLSHSQASGMPQSTTAGSGGQAGAYTASPHGYLLPAGAAQQQGSGGLAYQPPPPPLEPVPTASATTTTTTSAAAAPAAPEDYSFLVPALGPRPEAAAYQRHVYMVSSSPLSSPASAAFSSAAISASSTAPPSATAPGEAMRLTVAVPAPLSRSGSEPQLAGSEAGDAAAAAATGSGAGGSTVQLRLHGVTLPTPASAGAAELGISVVVSTSSSSATPASETTPSSGSSRGSLVTTTTTTTTTLTVTRAAGTAEGAGGAGTASGATAMKPDAPSLFTTGIVDTFFDGKR